MQQSQAVTIRSLKTVTGDRTNIAILNHDVDSLFLSRIVVAHEKHQRDTLTRSKTWFSSNVALKHFDFAGPINIDFFYTAQGDSTIEKAFELR